MVAAAATLPLLLAVAIAPRLTAATSVRTALGLPHVRGLDLLLGLCAGVFLRGVVEAVSPTAGGWSADQVDAAVWVSLIVAVTVSPIVEELLFRGLLQRALADGIRTSPPWVVHSVSVLVTTLVFVASHAITPAGTTLGVVTALVLVGITCGVLTVVTGRLAAPIAAHVVFNLTGVGLMFL